jgi:CoA:oxalate CoA-transferase
MATFPDNESILNHLDEHRVPTAPVMDPVDAINHPYFRERGMIKEIDDPIMGKLTIPGFPLRFSDQPERLELVAPTLGQHNQEILEQVLDYSEEKINELKASGVLVSGPR